MANAHERMDSGRLLLTRWLPVLAYVLLIFVLSAQPGLSVPGTWPYRDKLAHMLEYGGLSWLLYRAVRDTWPTRSGAQRIALTLFAISALGACDEKFQTGTPGRDSSVYDWMADTVGATFAQALGLALEKRRGVA